MVVGNLEERGEMAEVEANYNDDNLQGVFSCITFTSLEHFFLFCTWALREMIMITSGVYQRMSVCVSQSII